jgi:magnesium-transporting ATPase (P-type)
MVKPDRTDPLKEWLAWMLVVPVTILSLVAGLRVLLSWWKSRLPWSPTILPPDLDELEGLTDEEANTRRSYDPEEENKQARKKINQAILRRNLTSIFNLSMLGLAIATFMLGDILGGLTTLGVLIANVVVNTVQQVFAVNNVEKIAAKSRPKVNAIRAGKGKGLRVDEIVVGDFLVVGLGDQILADGTILRAADNLWVGDSAFAEHGKNANKRSGDQLEAGSYCVQGWAAYEVQALPPEELRTTQLNAIPATSADLTPLQKIIDRILRILLVITAIFVLILLQSILRLDVIPPDVQKLYRDVASIIFSIAPSGLFFMIVVSYNMGTFDLLKLGALVRDSRSVESLAQVSTICFGKSGTLTGIEVQLEMLPQPEQESELGESRVRQIIGDYAHNSSALSPLLREMRRTFEGQPRAISSESRFLSAYGWSAINFSDPDLQGTYVLAQPGLFPFEISPAEKIEKADEAEVEDTVVQKTWGRLRGFFRREEAEPEIEGDPTSEKSSQPEIESETPVEGEDISLDEAENPGIFQRLRKRVTSTLHREGSPEEEAKPEEHLIDPTQLIFAYSPEEQPLYEANAHPSLPENLIPLSRLTFSEQIRPEAKDAIQIFTDAGVQVKIISQQNAPEVVAAARQLGLAETQPGRLKTLSGVEIESLPVGQLAEVVREATVFAPVTSPQKGKIIQALRSGEEYVAMTGEGLGDIEAMQRANLSITVQGGTQAAVSFADIILLRDSLQALPQVLQQGRRIVNGLIDVLKLNLVQVAYIFFLLIAMLITQQKVFFYDPTQGGVIVFFTIVIPSLGLTLWAETGTISEKRILSQLLRFIIPVGLTSALASLAVYFGFEYLTSSVIYAQLGVTYTLSFTGMLMVLFIKPPNRFWAGDTPVRRDKRFIWMVLVMFVLFGIVLIIPLAQELLKVTPLRQIEHYLIIVVVTIIWAIITKLIWVFPIKLNRR